MNNPNALTVTTPSDREIVITRQFKAPRALVFDCYTKPEFIRRWLLGPDGWVMDVCDVDLRVGGAYRWVWRKVKDNTTMGMGGTYREIKRPEKLVTTELFDQDWTGGETVNTFVLTEKDGRTTIVNTVLYSSKTARDGALKTGMTGGIEKSYQRLDALLAQSATSAREMAEKA